jgi:hypothetical protein
MNSPSMLVLVFVYWPSTGTLLEIKGQGFKLDFNREGKLFAGRLLGKAQTVKILLACGWPVLSLSGPLSGKIRPLLLHMSYQSGPPLARLKSNGLEAGAAAVWFAGLQRPAYLATA